MKNSIVLLALATLVTSQNASALDTCGQSCLSGVESNLSSACPDASASCLCASSNFYYGLRDCGDQACGSNAALIAYGSTLCAVAGYTFGETPSATGSGSDTNTTITITTPSSTATITALETGSTAISTISVVTGVVVDNSTSLATVGVSTVFSPVGVVPVSTIPLTGTFTSGGSTFITTTGSATVYGTATSSGVSGATTGTSSGASSGSGSSSAAVALSTSTGALTTSVVTASGTTTGSSSSSSAGAAKKTAAAGLLAVAGMAAFVL